MPTNVTVEYAKAEQEYKKATTTEEKVKALQNMWREVPKHKGTENLRKDIKTKLAKFKEKLKKEAERKKKGKALTIKKEGSATVVLVGPPSSGKSLLLQKLTGKKTAVGEYDFTTKMPEVGIMDYKGLKMQVIEVPAITLGYFYKEKGAQFFSIIRNGDIVVIVTDTAELDYLFEEFNNAEIKLNEKSFEDFISLKAVIAVNKQDLNGFDDVYVGLCKYYNFDLVPISALTGDGLEQLKDRIWKNLGLIKVYTKEPGKKTKKGEPLCLKKGSNIEDMAIHIHKDFIRKFRFARVWGKSAKFGGQQVGLKHRLEDEDVVEVHLK